MEIKLLASHHTTTAGNPSYHSDVENQNHRLSTIRPATDEQSYSPKIPINITAQMKNPTSLTPLGDPDNCTRNCAINCAMGAVIGSICSASLTALLGFSIGSLGGTVLDHFDNLPESYKNNAIVAGTQGAIGFTALCLPMGFVGGAITGGTMLGDDGNTGKKIGYGLLSITFFNAVSNAVGNLMLAKEGMDHTGQLEGLAASGAGTITLTAATLGVVLCCICAGGTALACLGIKNMNQRT